MTIDDHYPEIEKLLYKKYHFLSQLFVSQNNEKEIIEKMNEKEQEEAALKWKNEIAMNLIKRR